MQLASIFGIPFRFISGLYCVSRSYHEQAVATAMRGIEAHVEDGLATEILKECYT